MSAEAPKGVLMSIFVLIVLFGAFAAFFVAARQGRRSVAPHTVWRPWAVLGGLALAVPVGLVLAIFVARTSYVHVGRSPGVETHVETYGGGSAHMSYEPGRVQPAPMPAPRVTKPSSVTIKVPQPQVGMPFRVEADGKPLMEMQVPVPRVNVREGENGLAGATLSVEGGPAFQFPNVTQFPTVTIDGESTPFIMPTESLPQFAPPIEVAENSVPAVELPDIAPDVVESPSVDANESNVTDSVAAAAASTVPDAWARLIAGSIRKGETLDLDPHVSLDTLQDYVIERIVVEFEKVGGPPNDRPSRINADQTVSLDFVNRLSTTLGAAAIGSLPPPGSKAEPRPSGDTWVDVRWENHTLRTPSWSNRPVLKGKLVARISGPKGSSVVSANLDEKPWLYEDGEPSGYVKKIVAMSGGPEISTSQAIQAVRRDAQAKIYPMVVAQFRQMSAGASVYNNEAALRHALQVSLNTNEGLIDQALVRVRRNYGDVWYAAQLRNTSDNVLRPIAAQAVSIDHQERQSFAQMVAGLVGMTVVLGVLYLLLNWFTRGYFRGRIGVAMVAMGLLAGVTLLVLMG